MLKSYKHRLYPSDEQKKQMDHHFGCCRMIWNLALQVKTTSWSSARRNVSRMDLQKQLVELKVAYPWLYDTNAQSLQSVLLHLEDAFNRFFSGNRYPKFKKKSGNQSFKCPQGVKVEENILILPKIKRVRCEGIKPFEGTVRTVTISRTPTGKYFASILVENNIALPHKPTINPEKTIGIDVGIKSFVVTSDGRFYEPNRFLKNSLRRLQCLQRRASRKKKGSNNRKKANLCVAKLHEHITNQRVDYCHKVTTGLIRDNQAETFVIEDLAVVNMLKNRKLSQAMSDVSLGEFFRQMAYKCEWYGKNLIKIGRFQPSSKTCSACGHVKQDLTLADREWTCESCCAANDRDLNAARNIKAFGLEEYSRRGTSGEPVERSAMKGRNETGKTLL